MKLTTVMASKLVLFFANDFSDALLNLFIQFEMLVVQGKTSKMKSQGAVLKLQQLYVILTITILLTCAIFYT